MSQTEHELKLEHNNYITRYIAIAALMMAFAIPIVLSFYLNTEIKKLERKAYQKMCHNTKLVGMAASEDIPMPQYVIDNIKKLDCTRKVFEK